MATSRFPTISKFVMFAALSACIVPAQAQHLAGLIWRPKDDQGSYRCIYGEIQVLSTAPSTYYCGCNWWPSCPAGGYTGIQDIDGRKRLMIFSIWDTTADLRSVAVDRGDPRTELSRFGGEGDGGKSLLPYHWEIGKTYRYFILKRQDDVNKCTLASSYFFDDEANQWVYEATIASPDNGDKCVKGFGGMMNAFLENFGKTDKSIPRLAMYRLWVGTTPDNLACVTESSGSGMWGTLNDWFFLAGGDDATLRGLLNGFAEGSSEPAFGTDGRLTVSDRKAPQEFLTPLKRLLGIEK